MPKFSSTSLVKSASGKRYMGEGSDDDVLTSDSLPLSLTMSPTLVWLNALGNKEAVAITNAWRPVFNVRHATAEEIATW